MRDLNLPVVCAPMAGGPSTPALVAAVSDVGGLGFLAAGYKTQDVVAAELDAARAATTAPIGVNLFVVEPYEPEATSLNAYRRSLEPEAARLGAELGEARWEDDYWRLKVDLVLDVRPDIVSFTFGCPSGEVLRQLADRGVLSSVTVTSVAEAQVAAARGAASLCVQGPNAGGHRGTWDLEADPDTTSLGDLVSAVVAVVDVPVVAGGGISGSGRGQGSAGEGRHSGTDRDRLPACGGSGHEPYPPSGADGPDVHRDRHHSGVHGPVGTRSCQPVHGRTH